MGFPKKRESDHPLATHLHVELVNVFLDRFVKCFLASQIMRFVSVFVPGAAPSSACARSIPDRCYLAYAELAAHARQLLGRKHAGDSKRRLF